MRESADTKAARLLTERKVRVFRVSERGIAARVIGDTGIHTAMHYIREGVEYRECDCTNGQTRPRKATCSHVKALAYLWPPIGGTS